MPCAGVPALSFSAGLIQLDEIPLLRLRFTQMHKASALRLEQISQSRIVDNVIVVTDHPRRAHVFFVDRAVHLLGFLSQCVVVVAADCPGFVDCQLKHDCRVRL